MSCFFKNIFTITLRIEMCIVVTLLCLSSVNAVSSEPNEDWHIRIIAQSKPENLVDRGTVIGELTTSTNQLDKHDLPELEPFSDPYLTVVLKKTVDNELVEFNSDFRTPDLKINRDQKQWRFTVKTDDPTRDVTLSWEGNGRLDRMVLVDMETEAEIFPVIAGRVRDYTFNMSGKLERDFIWKY